MAESVPPHDDGDPLDDMPTAEAEMQPLVRLLMQLNPDGPSTGCHPAPCSWFVQHAPLVAI
eukprot:5656330-Pleurochrysis_carterae.AAC.3